MQIVPVLDVLDGRAVHAVAGCREEYAPVRSRFGRTGDARGLARGFAASLGLHTLYVADLDAILHRRPNRELTRDLARDGTALLLDRGVRTSEDVREAVEDGAARVIVALETLPSRDALTELLAAAEPDRLVFSLDLRNGVPLAIAPEWRESSAEEIAADVVAAGIAEVVVLDLAAVGTGAGVPTLELCRRLRRSYPPLRIITGGGVRSVEDLNAIADAGADAALVASALHDGRIGTESVQRTLRS